MTEGPTKRPDIIEKVGRKSLPNSSIRNIDRCLKDLKPLVKSTGLPSGIYSITGYDYRNSKGEVIPGRNEQGRETLVKITETNTEYLALYLANGWHLQGNNKEANPNDDADQLFLTYLGGIENCPYEADKSELGPIFFEEQRLIDAEELEKYLLHGWVQLRTLSNRRKIIIFHEESSKELESEARLFD